MTIQFNPPSGLARTAPIVSALAAIRRAAQQQRYGDGPVPKLPSKLAVRSAIEAFTAVLYPRHYGPADLVSRNTDAYVASTLRNALDDLQEQIRRELTLFKQPSEVDNTQRIVDVFADRLPRVRALLDTDIRAAYAGDPAAKSLDEIIFCYPGVSALIKHRLAHELYLLGVPMLARIVSEIAHSQTGIDIHPGAEIDEGLFIDHGTGVVIGETARVGKYVRLYQAVTLGSKRFEVDDDGALVKNQPRHPIIEDGVVIYAGATVLGHVTIGAGSSIGGNVWLTHSVPPGSNITQAKARVETFDNGGGI